MKEGLGHLGASDKCSKIVARGPSLGSAQSPGTELHPKWPNRHAALKRLSLWHSWASSAPDTRSFWNPACALESGDRDHDGIIRTYATALCPDDACCSRFLEPTRFCQTNSALRWNLKFLSPHVVSRLGGGGKIFTDVAKVGGRPEGEVAVRSPPRALGGARVGLRLPRELERHGPLCMCGGAAPWKLR